MSWQMKNRLIMSHEKHLNNLAQQIPNDVKIYQEMYSPQQALDKTIKSYSSPKTLLWIKTDQAKITTYSDNLSPEITTVENITDQPKIFNISNQYWLMCSLKISFDEKNLQTIYVAQNINDDQLLLNDLLKTLFLIIFLTNIAIIYATSTYICLALKPIDNITKTAKNISPDKLKEVSLKFNQAPTEVRKLALTIEELLLKIGESWDNQEQLLSNVSHELRTPLTIVSGYLQSLLRRGDNLTKTQKEALTIANSEAGRTVQLLQDLLELARADSGNIKLQMEIVKLSELLREIIPMAQQYSQRQITLSIEDQNINIKVDINRFKQIFLNLLDNAIKYSSDDTLIEIRVSKKEDIIIEIEDHGIGIPLAYQNRIFERFYRMDEARTRYDSGSGLGLAIVKTLVLAMNGNISLISQPQKGTIFTLKFPYE
ncbi:MAG: HAMP domain-containing histidine kinase [Cyanobacterium sp. T60_A2020_053]|nr:HAMP domain-containing histidine kinase [Cyanobacterium sp. T60_A2020_053]